MKRLLAGAALVLLTVLVVIALTPAAVAVDVERVTPIRDYLLENARAQTGAINLVTAVYLGYRLYDTLGEAIVLMLAVSAVLFFLESKP